MIVSQDHFLCMGVVFYQKIADNTGQSSVSSKLVN